MTMPFQTPALPAQPSMKRLARSAALLGAVALGSFGTQAEAQIDFGGGGQMMLSDAGVGNQSITGSTSGGGLAAHSVYWDWDSGSWPAASFRLVNDPNATVDPASDRTDNAPFPSDASTLLPTSIGANGLMYAISVCSGTPTICDGAGYLWVEDGGETLHWYLRADWSGDWIRSHPGEVVHFDYLMAPPSQAGDFRYVSLDRY